MRIREACPEGRACARVSAPHLVARSLSCMLPGDGPLTASALVSQRRNPRPGLGKLTPGAIESDAFVLSQEKGEDVFKLLAGCWALGQRGDKPQG